MPALQLTPQPFATSAPARRYTCRLATTEADVRAAQALRFEVFNLELDEGLVASYDTGLDVDPFDAVCDHLLVEDALHGEVVGTYRLQTGRRASESLGYYSEQAFDFTPFEDRRTEMIELGRACVHRRHRSFGVLNLLWTGIADYAAARGARYLVGCSSLTSQDPAVGAAAWRQLQAPRAPPGWRTRARPGLACPLPDPAAATAPADLRLPRLLSMYLALGAAVCGPPAIDRAFRTIDFLTWIDLRSEVLQAWWSRGRFGGPRDIG